MQKYHILLVFIYYIFISELFKYIFLWNSKNNRKNGFDRDCVTLNHVNGVCRELVWLTLIGVLIDLNRKELVSSVCDNFDFD